MKADIDEHDIVNRIMRRENFMIAMFNKDLVPAHVSLPLLGRIPFMPKALEWSLFKSILDYAFDSKHRVCPWPLLVFLGFFYPYIFFGGPPPPPPPSTSPTSI